jgi:excisionase family DNA binding protein
MKEDPAMAVQKLLLSPEEVGKALSISRSRVYELIRTGELPHMVLPGGRLIRVHAASLAAMFAPTSNKDTIAE